MSTIKAFTDIEQSKKLAKILPIESADMYYPWYIEEDRDNIKSGHRISIPSVGNFIHKVNILPCWSLAALLEQLPYEVCDDYGDSLFLKMDKDNDVYQLTYIDTYGIADKIYTDRYEHFVDACVAMVEKLNELNLL